MEEISPTRFNAIAGYARQPMARIIGEEIAYFEGADGTIMGMVIRDRTDSDFSGLLFGQDKKLRFRWTSMTGFFQNLDDAVDALKSKMEELQNAPAEYHHQGDEVGAPVDFFTPIHKRERLHPDFVTLIDSDGFSPAREIIKPMMRWHEDADGNFVEQFQTTGFDQRIWELYLFSMLIEQGYKIDKEKAVPDFCCAGLQGQMAIEAVTVGPTRNGSEIVPPPPIETPEEKLVYLKEYMPIKFGSPLFSKLKKEYWKHDHVAGIPLVLAIADFSSVGSMSYTSSALERYLYGFSFDETLDENGNPTISQEKIAQHTWGEKTIPSGYFDIPEAENISAVISTTAGTISKFNRIGLSAGFGSGNVLMIREGTLMDHDPKAQSPLYFKGIVNDPDHHETWVEGLNVYHNPRAKIPPPEHMFQNAAHHYCDENGDRSATIPEFHPLASRTQILAPVDVQKALAEAGGTLFRVWKRKIND